MRRSTLTCRRGKKTLPAAGGFAAQRAADRRGQVRSRYPHVTLHVPRIVLQHAYKTSAGAFHVAAAHLDYAGVGNHSHAMADEVLHESVRARAISLANQIDNCGGADIAVQHLGKQLAVSEAD